jgi:hypothetical protein
VGCSEHDIKLSDFTKENSLTDRLLASQEGDKA